PDPHPVRFPRRPRLHAGGGPGRGLRLCSAVAADRDGRDRPPQAKVWLMSEGSRFRKRPQKDFRARKPQRGRDFPRAPADIVILYGWHSVTLALANPQRK